MSLSKTLYPQLSTGFTQEDRKLSQYGMKNCQLGCNPSTQTNICNLDREICKYKFIVPFIRPLDKNVSYFEQIRFDIFYFKQIRLAFSILIKYM